MNVIRILLAIGLVVLGLVGVGAHVTPWLSWLVFAIGVLGLIGSGMVFSRVEYGRPTSGTMGVACLVLWIIGLAARAMPWLTWWTFAFGVAFLVTAFVAEEGEPLRHPA